MKKRVIAVVLRSHPLANMGGAPFQAGIIAEQLALRTDHSINYLANRTPPPDHGLPYQITNISDPNHWLYKKSLVFDYFNISSALKKLNPDIIYQNALTAHTGYCALYAKKHKKQFIYHVASDYDLEPNHYFATSWKMKILEAIEKRLASYALRNADNVLVQTSKQKDLLLRNYGRSECTIFENILPAPEKITNHNELKTRVIWVANFKPIKQPELFVQLAEDFSSRDDVEFVMIGRPGLNMGYQALLDRAEALKNLHFLGEQDISSVNAEISKSHILVNTSLTEGYSNTYVQAWQRGLPVVSLNADIDNLLKDRKLGILGGSYEGLKQAVTELVEDKSLRSNFSGSTIEYTEKNNSLKSVEKLINLLW